MVLSKKDACDLLELPTGADSASVRTSYKRLALKWHPETHKNSAEAIKKFKKVTCAFLRLTDEHFDAEQERSMALEDMLEHFENIYFNTPLSQPCSNGYDSSDYEEDEEDEEDQGYVGLLSDRINGIDSIIDLTPEQIEKNASDLITEEEKEKKKAEKRREKKKRKRLQKKLEKQEAGTKDDSKSSTVAEGQDSKKNKSKDKKKQSTTEEDEFDQSAAFFTQVVNKKKKAGVIPDAQANSSKSKSIKTQSSQTKDEESEELDPKILRSRQLAIRGNEMANSGHYQAAIDLFTEAMHLDPADFRFSGNRSYCFDRMQQYDRALRDAEKAITLAPDWPKGYFRKGRALAGLKLYADAEHAFMQVLKLDRNCEDAMQELLHVRTHQITEMGFSRSQAESAIRTHGSVAAALDSLLAGVLAENTLSPSAGDVSDDDDIDDVDISQMAHQHTIRMVPAPVPVAGSNKPTDIKMDSHNPEGLTALWVGNVLPVVTDKKLTQMFSKYGPVTSVRCLPEKYCAFINYKTKEAAGRAMNSLQGVECAGQRLLIKFPDNPINNTGNLVLRKTGATSQPRTQPTNRKQTNNQRYRKF